MTKFALVFSLVIGTVVLFGLPATANSVSPKALEIYFIDVEGGQSTLLVTPSGESLLIDAGWAGSGTLGEKPGDPAKSRDANRIVAAARDAGIKQIDYALITHFHPDHDGGVVELAQLIPIRHFIDHGGLPAEAHGVSVLEDPFEAYLAVRKKVPHTEPKPGDRLPLTDVDATVVSSAESTITKPLAHAGKRNTLCRESPLPAGDTMENVRSTGIVLAFGKFRFLDIGDLSGKPLFDLACPESLVGPVDVYLVAHHGDADAADPATFAAFRPRVAIMNNGRKKGGALETYKVLHNVSGLEDVWQLDFSENAADQNFAPERIANLNDSTAYWIKLLAAQDGSFRVQNGRTGEWKSYPARHSP